MRTMMLGEASGVVLGDLVAGASLGPFMLLPDWVAIPSPGEVLDDGGHPGPTRRRSAEGCRCVKVPGPRGLTGHCTGETEVTGRPVSAGQPGLLRIPLTSG